MHYVDLNWDLCQKGGAYTITVGHCQKQLGSRGRCKLPVGPGRALVGVLGAKPESC